MVDSETMAGLFAMMGDGVKVEQQRAEAMRPPPMSRRQSKQETPPATQGEPDPEVPLALMGARADGEVGLLAFICDEQSLNHDRCGTIM
jgi:hypothetical protein